MRAPWFQQIDVPQGWAAAWTEATAWLMLLRSQMDQAQFNLLLQLLELQLQLNQDLLNLFLAFLQDRGYGGGSVITGEFLIPTDISF